MASLLELVDSAGLIPPIVVSLPALPFLGVEIISPAKAISAEPGPFSGLVTARIGEPTDDEKAAPSLFVNLELIGVALLGLAGYGAYRLVRG